MLSTHPAAAEGPNLQLEHARIQAEAAADAKEDGDARVKEAEGDRVGTKPARREKTFTPLVVPIPQSNPAVGSGLVLAGLVLYQPKGSDKPWATGAAAFYFDSGSKGLGVFQEAHLKGDDIRLMGLVGYADIHMDFFGIGTAAGGRGLSIPLDEKGAAIIAQGLYRVRGRFYAGAHYRFVDVDTTIDTSQIPAPDLNIPTIELESRISLLGPAVQYDSRDSEFNPQRGIMSQGQWLFASDKIGSDFDYSRLTGEFNIYRPVAGGTLAARAYACSVTRDAPFYDLCMFGSGVDLRGYVGGQFRDRSMAAVQVEYRRPLFWRIGAVAFAGVGAVAPKLDDLPDAKPLPSIGVGVRYQALKKYRMNVGADFAFADGSTAFYIRIGEAF